MRPVDALLVLLLALAACAAWLLVLVWFVGGFC